MSNSFLNWTSRVAIAGRVAGHRRPQDSNELTTPGDITCPSAKSTPGQKPQSGSGKSTSSDRKSLIALPVRSAVELLLTRTWLRAKYSLWARTEIHSSAHPLGEDFCFFISKARCRLQRVIADLV